MIQLFDLTARGVVLMALLVLVEAIELVIISGLISSFIPFKTDPFNVNIFSVYQSSIRPTRQMLIYHIFIVSSILAQAIGIYAFRKKLGDKGFQHNIIQLLCVDSIWVFIQCFAIFKFLVYTDSGWAWALFYISLAASILSRIFWIELVNIIGVIASKAKIATSPSAEKGPRMTAEFPWTPLLILVESIQVVIGFAWLLDRHKATNFLFLYGVFIASIGLFFFLSRARKAFYFKTKPFIIAEMIITFFLLSALFKMVIYDYRNQLAINAYDVLLVVAILNKIAWPSVWQGLQVVWAFMTEPRNVPTVKMIGDVFVAGFIIVTIYTPDPQAVLAKMYIGDQFLQTNCFIMAPGWAYVKGCLLDVDVMSRYGLGIPIVLGSLAQWFGGYSYLSMFLVIMWVCIIYFLLCYLFLRLWLKSFMLAFAAILVGIKAQLFYTLSFPQPFTYPNSLPVRFMLDIVFMLCIWGHLKTRRWGYLLSAAFCCGASFFCIPETGLYLGAAFYAYLILLAMVPSLRHEIYGSVKNRVKAAFCALMVPGSAFVLMWSYLGSHLLKKEFWDNIMEISKLYTSGFWMGPFNGGLQYGQFWDLLVGMSFPLVYILTILIVGTLCVLKKIPEEHLMAVVLAFYGLGAHHYYVVMATANNYYPRGLPFVFIIFYWVGWFFACLDENTRRRAGAALVAFCAYCLWTNHHYLSYPNKFNFSRNPMIDPLVAERLPDRRYYFNHKVINTPEDLKVPLNSLGEKDEDLRTDADFKSDEDLKAYYEKETDFSRDVRLIQSFVPPAQPVALMSSYETEMLMQADRKPFFYYFRVFQSRPLRMRSFPTLDIWTTIELNKLISQLQDMRPTYVFMERIFLQDPTPAQYPRFDPGLMGLLDYVKSHYQPYAYGKFLVAMKRKEG